MNTDPVTILGSNVETLLDILTGKILKGMVECGFVSSNEQPAQELAYTPQQVADKLGVSVDTVRNKLIHGDPTFPYKKIGSNYMIPARALTEWLNDTSNKI